MQSFYQHYYKKYIQALQNAADKADRLPRHIKLPMFFLRFLKAVNMTQSMEVDREILETQDKVAEKTEILVPYNILPLYPDSANQAIMRFPEIQAAVYALHNTRGLAWPKDYKKKKDEDILDWLGVLFGFQKHNVSNQREHLILLLANVHIRQFPKPDQQPKLDERALTEVMKKLFKNYKKWCKYLGRNSSLWLPTIQQEVQQRKLLYMGLYLLIWGEAANLRFIPECLCYIYHHHAPFHKKSLLRVRLGQYAFELYGMLAGNVSPMTGENVKPAYGGEDEAFLRKVVTPIYDVIAKEAARSKKGRSKHSQWRNYDDLNEYFWSADCFQLGWPMRADADFFCLPVEQLNFDKSNRRFLWGAGLDQNKIAWIRWDTVTSPKENGGLDIKDITNFNIALLGKWRWGLMQNKGELWARVVQSKYGGWQGMLAADRLGLESVWWRDLKKTLVHSPQGQIINSGMRWNFTWRRLCFDNEIDSAAVFLNEIQDMIFPHQGPDVWEWTANPTGQYTANNAYKTILSDYGTITMAHPLCIPVPLDNKPTNRDKWIGKVNFVEIRSFWHIFRSFDRMWGFFILCLQAMIIVAWNGSGDPSAIFNVDVFKKSYPKHFPSLVYIAFAVPMRELYEMIFSVFVTAAILKLGQGVGLQTMGAGCCGISAGRGCGVGMGVCARSAFAEEEDGGVEASLAMASSMRSILVLDRVDSAMVAVLNESTKLL
ncbi:Callose synthase 3 isoform B [Glycine soja]|uniref:Callose synthase 3 isoform B n=1 Tax=Glycine soja TaxID=3848 RepID=A0A445F9Y9_GLYSO|nr:Callose synthase 3 isoform B [Glycine soja]